MAEDLGQSLDFEGEIEAQDNEFEALPAGEYNFEVQAVERQQFNGSAKMAACPIAHVRVRVASGEHEGRVLFSNIFLNSKAAWRIKQFFVCIGLHPVDAPKEQKVRMDWSHAVGRRGKLKLGTREYNGKTYNDVTEWMKPEPAPAQAAYAPPASAVQAPPAVQQMVSQAVYDAQRKTTPGAF